MININVNYKQVGSDRLANSIAVISKKNNKFKKVDFQKKSDEVLEESEKEKAS